MGDSAIEATTITPGLAGHDLGSTTSSLWGCLSCLIIKPKEGRLASLGPEYCDPRRLCVAPWKARSRI